MTEIPELCPSLPRPFSLLIMDVREFQLYGSVNQDLYTPPIRLISRMFFETEALTKNMDTPSPLRSTTGNKGWLREIMEIGGFGEICLGLREIRDPAAENPGFGMLETARNEVNLSFVTYKTKKNRACGAAKPTQP